MLQDVTTYITKKGCLSSMFPRCLVEELQEECPDFIKKIQIILDQYGRGFALFGRALVASLNLPCLKGVPADLICDVLILTKQHCPILFSFCETSSEDMKQYNNELSKDSKRLIRRFTGEKFTSVFSVLERMHIRKKGAFENLLKERQRNLQSCFQEQTFMNVRKFQNILQSVVVCIGRTSIPISDEVPSGLRESFHLLSREHLITLTNKIDNCQTNVIKHNTMPDETVCIFELAERLNKMSPTVLICDPVWESRKWRHPNVKISGTEDATTGQVDLSQFTNIVLATTELQYVEIKRFISPQERRDVDGSKKKNSKRIIFFYEGQNHQQGIRIALIGGQRVEQRSLGNAIVNDLKFRISFSTGTPAIDINCASRSGRAVTVTDTPGLSLERADAARLTVKYLHDNIDAIDAVLLVVRASQLKEEEEMMLHLIMSTFSSFLFGKLVVLFTYANERPDYQDFLRDVPKSLDELLHKCGERFMFYDTNCNSQSEEKDNQFNQLVEMIDGMKHHEGRSYSTQNAVEDFPSAHNKIWKTRKVNKSISFLTRGLLVCK